MKPISTSFWVDAELCRLKSLENVVPCGTSGLEREEVKVKNKSSGATALQGLGRQSARRRSAKLVPTFADRGVSRGQRDRSPRPLISVYRTWIATYFIQVAPQLTSGGSRGWVHPVPDPLPLRKSGSAGNRTRDLCICSQKPWPLDHRGSQEVKVEGENYTVWSFVVWVVPMF